MSLAFTLYSRSWCHLCEDMRQALLPLLDGVEHTLEVLDVDADPALVALYDELVPVLVGRRPGAAPVQLCHWFLDREAVAAFLAD